LKPDILREAKAVELEVAFGSKIDELERRIAATSLNGDHPANPIIEWQTEAVGEAMVEK